MRSVQTCLLVVVSVTLATVPLLAVNRVVKPTDYSAIEKRNPFGLVDPPKPQVIVAPVEPVAKEPPPNVELTGMFHDSVRKKTYALFMVEVKGESKKRSYMLSEGEKQEGLRVLKIDRESSNVKIDLKGQESTITFNKPKAAEPSPNRGMPPGMGANAAARRQVRPVRSPVRVDSPNVQQFSTSGRNGTFSGSGRSVSAVAGGMTTLQPNGSNGSLRSMPTRQMRTQQPMTRQEQEIIIEAQRKVNEIKRQQNPGSEFSMPPLPPTSLTPPRSPQ